MRISDWSSDLCSSDLARRQIVAEPHVGDFGARLGFGERAGGGDPVGGEIEGDGVRDQRVEAGFLGRVGDGEAAGERELAVRETPVARRGGQDQRDVADLPARAREGARDRAPREAAIEMRGLDPGLAACRPQPRSEEHTSELQSLMRISYAVFCLQKKKELQTIHSNDYHNNIRVENN